MQAAALTRTAALQLRIKLPGHLLVDGTWEGYSAAVTRYPVCALGPLAALLLQAVLVVAHSAPADMRLVHAFIHQHACHVVPYGSTHLAVAWLPGTARG
jgi:hypothetical protein